MFLAQLVSTPVKHIRNPLLSRDEEEEETTEAESSIHMQHSDDTAEKEAVSLEGYLLCRMGKSSGHSSLRWKRRFVYFSFADGGSITVYRESPNFNVNRLDADDSNKQSSKVLRTVYKKLSRHNYINSDGTSNVDFDITPELPWIAKDVEKDPATFVVEIPTSESSFSECEGSISSASEKSGGSVMVVNSRDEDELAFETDEARNDEEDSVSTFSSSSDANKNASFPVPVRMDSIEKAETFSLDGHRENVRHDLSREMAAARKRKKPLHIYFRCEKGSNEKALWIRAFAHFGRLSSEHIRHRGLINTLTAPLFGGQSNAKIRSKENAVLARHTRNLELSENSENPHEADASGKEEYRLLPTYAYPHRWMTRAEMRDEMMLPSERFHDLRVPGCKQKEIGSLKVEVLQCLGLPKLDRAGDTDAIVYLVCGAYSFCTDVIPNRKNPIWLRKSRRACNFPLFHGYASLYIGVFDNEAKSLKDDFAGRVEIHLSKLRPGSVYDVTLPLRLSTHVYYRRKRGAVRLRLCLNWTTEFDALMSYIPKKIRIPSPQNSVPNFDTTVRCTDPKAFRNIAITVHGAHLPGRFTFLQMRAAIREINFTRKYIFTAIRYGFRDLRQWRIPAMSGYVFFTWMHCVHANQFSLVPAYVALYILIILMCNYVKYNTDGPGQRGFIPPSWEEMFMALIRRNEPGYHAIEPLELIPRKKITKGRKSIGSNVEKQSDYIVSTHVPKGKGLAKMLGLLPSKDSTVNEDHLEFPFANGKDYPKFTVEECLVQHKGSEKALSSSFDNNFLHQQRERAISLDSGNALTRFSRDMDLHDIMRKDLSGTKEFDEEEMNFNATKAVFAKGKKATSKISTAIGVKAGLNSALVNTLQSGISSGIDVGVSHLNYISNHVVHPRRSIVGNSSCMDSTTKRAYFQSSRSQESQCTQGSLQSTTASFVRDVTSSQAEEKHSLLKTVPSTVSSANEYFSDEMDETDDDSQIEKEDIDPLLVFPEQNIDVEGPNSGRKITDDLAEIKDKMHELTWHLFDDQTYVIKNSNTVYFGDSKKPEKKRKTDVKKQVDKFLRVQQYSHSNPFVSRVGMYVEPIIGSSYSFLCLFRAGFNLFTWRDPFMTFLLSLLLGFLVIVLFIFPWRLFLFVVGVLIVGPQNWAIRILRERGHLPPVPAFKVSNSKLHMFEEEINELPTDVPIFTSEDRKQGNEPKNRELSKENPQEIHHVVVPYTPLIYQRCYDWPPEAKYANVKREFQPDNMKRAIKTDVSLKQALSTVSEPGTYHRHRIGFRRRLRRRKMTEEDKDGGKPF